MKKIKKLVLLAKQFLLFISIYSKADKIKTLFSQKKKKKNACTMFVWANK